MVQTLFDARVEDLGPDHRVLVRCGQCGHEGIISRAQLVKRGVKPYERILGLQFKARCVGCGSKRSIMHIQVIQLNDIPARMPGK